MYTHAQELISSCQKIGSTNIPPPTFAAKMSRYAMVKLRTGFGVMLMSLIKLSSRALLLRFLQHQRSSNIVYTHDSNSKEGARTRRGEVWICGVGAELS